MILAQRKQNILGSISEFGSILRDINCPAQKTSTETERNTTDLRLCVPIIIDRNDGTLILQVHAFPNESINKTVDE